MGESSNWSLASHIERRQRGVNDPSIADALKLAAEVERTRFGSPGHCPECGKAGYVRSLDVRHRITHSSCRQCGTFWSSAEEA